MHIKVTPIASTFVKKDYVVIIDASRVNDGNSKGLAINSKDDKLTSQQEVKNGCKLVGKVAFNPNGRATTRSSKVQTETRIVRKTRSQKGIMQGLAQKANGKSLIIPIKKVRVRFTLFTRLFFMQYKSFQMLVMF